MPVDVVAVFTGLAMDYGLLGLLVSSFLGSTIFIPLSVETTVFPILIKLGIDLYWIVIIASIGSLLGTYVNYGLGRYSSVYIKKKVGEERINKAKEIMDRYGWPGLLVVLSIPLPFPVDALTIIPGIARMNFLWFSIVVFTSKLLRYAFFVGVLSSIIILIFPH